MSGILIVDKPAGWTSQDVCAKLRGLLHERRVGHGGTLDPMATGVLPVFCGRATRAVSFAVGEEKRYVAGIRFGITTDTQDITGRVLTCGGGAPGEADIRAVLPRFTGEQEQTPPMYSAVRVNGERLYRLARRGADVERAPRRITIMELSLLGSDGDDFLLDIRCSKGTYIRTLCADIGAALGCGAVMSSLRRMRVGPFTIDDAHTMEELSECAASGTLSGLLRPVDSLFAQLPAVTLSSEEERRCRCGNALPFASASDGRCRVYGEDGTFLMLGETGSGLLKPVKSFFEVG